MMSTTKNCTLSLWLALVLAWTGRVVHANNYNEMSACRVQCGPFGNCVLDTHECGDECRVECVCQPGWIGEDCSIKVDRCTAPITSSPDEATTCFNGGKCESYAEDGTDELLMRCNCQAAPGSVETSVGHQCEFTVDEEDVCEEGRTYSTYAFCVNGGTCRRMVAPGEFHPKCNCATGFEGRHCQFASGTAPLSELIYTDSNNYVVKAPTVEPEKEEEVKQLKPGHKFLIAFFSFVTVAAMVVVCCRCRSTRKNDSEDDMAKPNATNIPDDLTFDVIHGAAPGSKGMEEVSIQDDERGEII